MEEKIRAIVIKNIDFKEKDKQIVLFSLEKGKIIAFLRGVKAPKAKLKYAKELFCFADYILVEGKAGSVITSCEVIDTFFDITKKYENYACGAMILEVVNSVIGYNEPNPALFLECLRALKVLAYEDVKPEYVAVKFLISIFEGLGYQLSLNKCSSCGGPFIHKRFLNLDSGEITCLGCKAPNSIEISSTVHSALRVLFGTDYEKLSSLKLAENSEKETLSILAQNFEQRFSKKLKIF